MSVVRRLCGLLGLWLCVGACGESEPSVRADDALRPRATPPASSPWEEPGAWTAATGWPGQARKILPEGALNARVVRVVADAPRARFWVLSYVVMEEGAAPRFSLRGYDRGGNVAWSSDESEAFRAHVTRVGAAIGDVAVHSDGAVSVLVLKPVEPYQGLTGAWSTLHFLRFDADGALLRERPFEAPLDTAQPAWCDAPDGRSWACRPEQPGDELDRGPWLAYWREPGMGFPLANRLLADGDALILLRADRGYRLHRFDAAYRATAGAIVLPASDADRGSAPRLARDAAGRVVVMHVADESLLALLAAGGGPRLSLDDLTAHDATRRNGVLLQYFDGATLERVAAHLLAPPSTMLPTALAADSDEVVAVLNYLPREPEPMQRERKRDVVLVRATLQGASPHFQRIDVAYGDGVTDAVAFGGRVWLSGVTRDDHGDDARGLVAAVDRAGNVGPLWMLTGPRSMQTDALAEGGDGRLLVGGIEDVPDLSACGFHATFCDTQAFVGQLPVAATGTRMRADRVPLASTSWRAQPRPE